MIEVKVEEMLKILRGYPYEIIRGDLSELRNLQHLSLLPPEAISEDRSPEEREEVERRGLTLLNKRVKLPFFPKLLIIDVSLIPYYSELSQNISQEVIVIALKGTRDFLRELLELAYNPWWRTYEGRNSLAYIEDHVEIGKGTWIGPFSVIMRGSKIGDNVKIFPFVYIGRDVVIEDNSVIMPGAIIMDNVHIGKNAYILPGAVIGADGFGFVRNESGWLRIPHMGGVWIGDNVEVGANTTIDRGTLRDTKVDKGVKIDNLVHVGHNCEIGENVMLIAQVGVAGSVKVGKNTIIAGQSGVKDNLEIGEESQIGGGSVVVKNVPPGAKVWGFPAVNHAKWVKMIKWLEGQVERKL